MEMKAPEQYSIREEHARFIREYEPYKSEFIVIDSHGCVTGTDNLNPESLRGCLISIRRDN